MTASILIADDDRAQRRFLSTVLSADGYRIEEAGGGGAAVERLLGTEGGGVSLLLLDLLMPDLDGLSVLRKIRAAGLTLPVLVITADGSITRAVEAMRAGATDFLVKPVAPERLTVSIRNALAIADLSTEVRRLSRRHDNRLSFDELIAIAGPMREAIALARRAARSDIPLLIEGESGTGKEVFARAVHGSGDRAGRPFVAVNCGAIPATLVESTLFGHEKGAFTGATARRAGMFQEAQGGTLFLDEVGELPLDAQVKLLRALQTGEVDPVGASEPVRVDIRLISATNRRLEEMIADGRFREDLYYRLSVFPLRLPPLRDRRDDIPGLARMFLSRFVAEEEVPIEGISRTAMEAIMAAPWPGNVRELENTIHRAVVLADGPMIEPEDLRGPSGAIGLRRAPPDRASDPPDPAPVDGACTRPTRGDCGLGEAGPRDPHDDTAPCEDPFLREDGHIRRLIEIEADAIQRAIALYKGKMSETARRLGIGRSTLYRKIEELRIGPSDR
ncbi:MAG: sigma-54-dependent transcriptional regulator [Paracoccaceae bacterium]